MTSRIIVDEDSGQNIDEYLEICFSQVFSHETEGEEGDAIEEMLAEYANRIFGENAVPTKGIITDLLQAILWVTQFGELRIHALSPKYIRELLASDDDYPKDIKYGAKIGPAAMQQKSVCGSTIHQVVLLAGIQVLRETSYGILNSDADQTSH